MTNKILSTVTELNKDPNLQLITRYLGPGDAEKLPDILAIFVALQSGSRNQVPYFEGEIIVVMKNHPEKVDLFINSNGELIIYAENGVLNYGFDENGNIVYADN